MARKVYTQEELDTLAAECREVIEALEILKRARAEKWLLRDTATRYVKLNHEWQKAKYGKVVRHLNAERLAANHG